ncbi:hypothetical protein ACS0TY_014498 [Phlomoides rotata]
MQLVHYTLINTQLSPTPLFRSSPHIDPLSLAHPTPTIMTTTFLAPLFFFFFLLSTIPNSHQTPTISAAPALLPDPSLSPDVAPLLPSPSRAARSPSGLSMPTIPSTRTPNPDAMDSVSPDSAVAPSAYSIMDSSAFSLKPFFFAVLPFWLVVLFIMS